MVGSGRAGCWPYRARPAVWLCCGIRTRRNLPGGISEVKVNQRGTLRRQRRFAALKRSLGWTPRFGLRIWLPARSVCPGPWLWGLWCHPDRRSGVRLNLRLRRERRWLQSTARRYHSPIDGRSATVNDLEALLLERFSGRSGKSGPVQILPLPRVAGLLVASIGRLAVKVVCFENTYSVPWSHQTPRSTPIQRLRHSG